ncbi:MAG: hydrogenase maturation nickel metallochaperone HypA [Gammaproteobacteria bacterium]|nr:hydrogenase maturation nickel metallochaperone HypA [Gammaproteobacteria bacterium]MDH4255306.1 hydrogenase maturation nickel metallochaperone HypA [Gammaproteobacteria bacterium]MDH5273123.1 hydrogenase maturation nickel metallochaperone HypA [Gammaproteobacteria bacterium]
MHEMAVSESLVQTLEREAALRNFTRVRTVFLELGPYSGVEVEALRFSFDVVSRGTLAEDATLDITERPATAWCMCCSKSVVRADRLSPCPDCGSYQLHADGGDQLRIRQLEVD